jgi:hypothetical protein
MRRRSVLYYFFFFFFFFFSFFFFSSCSQCVVRGSQVGSQGGALGRRSCVPLPAWAVARPGGSVGMPELFRRLPLMLRNRTLVFVGDAHSAALHLDLAWAVEVHQLRVRVVSSLTS